MAIQVTRVTDPRHIPELSSILAKAFSHDPLFKVECPDQDSINAMRRETEHDVQSILNETGPHTASVWAATNTLTGQILGFARWTHAVHPPIKHIPNEPSPSSYSAPELYANLSAIKKATLMRSGPFHCKSFTASSNTPTISFFSQLFGPKVSKLLPLIHEVKKRV